MTSNNPNDALPTSTESRIEKIKAGFNLIPVVGGAMADLAGQYLAGRRNRRLAEFLEGLQADFESHKEAVNQEFMGREEFEDLFEDLLERASGARQREKLEALRSVFLATILEDAPSYDEAAEMLALLDQMQPRHITLLRILADPLRADAELGHVVGPGTGGGFSSTSFEEIFKKLLPDWDRDQIERTWTELHDWKIHRSSFGGMMTDRGIHHLEGRLTDYGGKVVAYLVGQSSSRR